MRIILFLVLSSLPLLSFSTTVTLDELDILVKECTVVVLKNIISDTRSQFDLKESAPMPTEIDYQINNVISPRIEKVCTCTVDNIKSKHTNKIIKPTSEIFKSSISLLSKSRTGCAKYFREQDNEILNPPYLTELQKLEKTDQKIRKELVPEKNTDKVNLKNFDQVDKGIQKKLMLLIKKYGWPTKDDIGLTGLSTFALLLSHSDKKTRLKTLPYFKSLFEKGELPGQFVALLTDKLLISNGKKQRYGTQLKYVKGELVLLPIDDEINVDKRRKQMGMMSLKEYLIFTNSF